MPDERSEQAERRHGAPLDPGLLVGSTDAEILQCFLDLVRTWRGYGRRSSMRLRQADVAVLVAILGTDSAEVERRLVAATACSPNVARRGRRLLLASVGALALGLVTASPLGSSATSAPISPLDRARPIATSTVVRSAPVNVPVDPVAPIVEVDRIDPVVPQPAEAAPVTPAPPPPAAVAEVVAEEDEDSVEAASVPSLASLPAGTEAVVTIASVGMELPVVSGGQSVIDRGVVAHYTADGWEPPVAAGAPGTYWLAAHRTTHGGPFRTLPDVAVGNEIRVKTGSHAFVYTVTSMEVTGLFPGDDAVYGTDPTAAVILLQTCIDGNRRLLVHGTLTATL